MRTAPEIRPSRLSSLRQSFRSPSGRPRRISRSRVPSPGIPAPLRKRLARALTWGADEKVLLVLAAAGWLASRGCGEPLQRAGNHAALVAVAASLLPHGMKLLFDQTRPDRRTVLGHVHGISFSGKREDAFPSGHALHMGALASAAGTLPAGPRRAIQSARGRALAHARRGSGPLGERCRRRIRAGSIAGAAPSSLDRLSARISSRRTIMPILEDLKDYGERATGLRPPRQAKSPGFGRGGANPMPSASRMMVSSPTIRDGR